MGDFPRIRQALRCSIALLLVQPSARGGGAGENLIVVVNNRSWASKAVANAYVELRDIPASNVVYLDGLDGFEHMEVDAFRDKILRPVGRHIDHSGLSRQIDYIAYSADLPTNIGLGQDFKRHPEKLPKVLTAEGSINGLTYLYPYVLTTNLNFVAMNVNVYTRNVQKGFQRPKEGESMKDYLKRLEADGRNVSGIAIAESRGFRGRYSWDAQGNPQPRAGPRFMLSTMLGVTSGDGQSVDGAIRTLRRAVEADGTRPTGTFYFMVNNDIRTKTRQWAYYAAVEHLRRLGHRAVLVNGTLPVGRNNVLGLTLGSPRVDWVKSGCRAVPGAIIDNLTSFGGSFFTTRGRGQTPLSDFLRGGATASCGTVTEPYALQAKFPLPFLHLHSVKGCTMAESFYQSVSSPYQLLIVGDPLCAPWVERPRFELKGLKPGADVMGKVEVTPRVEKGSPSSINHFECFIDGKLAGVCGPTGSIPVDSSLFADGYHELSVLASAANALESTGRKRIAMQFNNHGLPDIQVEARPEIPLDRNVELRVRMTGAARIRLFHNQRLLGTVEGPDGALRVPAHILGMGPVRVFAAGEVRTETGSRHRRSSPALFRIIEPVDALAPMPAKRGASLSPGLRLEVDGAPAETIRRIAPRYVLQTLKAEGAKARVSGYVKVADAGLHQFQVRCTAPVTVRLNGNPQPLNAVGSWTYLPVKLEKGTHFLQAEVTGQGAPPSLDIRFGRQGTDWVDHRFWNSESP